ncbi:MAG: tetratricopeptide repeat protein [Pseudomonadales bacterium]
MAARRLPYPLSRARALRCSALVIWGLLLASLSARATDPLPPAADYYERAVNAAQAGAALQGRLALEPLLHRPRLPREQRAFAYFLRGLLFYRDQLFVSAAQDYQRALEFDPSHAPAQNALAWLTLKGLGVAPNPRRARHLYTQAAHQGHLEALFNGAVLKEQGIGGPVDVSGALAFYREAAVQGHEASLLRAGELLAQGQVSADLAAPIEALLTNAAEAGLGEAAAVLATLWGPQDATQARAWRLRAATAGVPRAQFQLAAELEAAGNESEALQWLKAAAKVGHEGAQRRLAWALESGSLTRRDLPEALRWYARAAAKGDPYAQTALARLKWTGQGLAQDQSGALALLRKASTAGYQDAQRALAWHLATAANPELRNAAYARALAEPLAQAAPTASHLAVLAAAHAASGDFAEALRWQKRALASAADPEPLQRALLAYERKELLLE